MLPLPLYLLHVLDLTRSAAGAFAGRALADLGAEVVCVESAAAPSPLRADAVAFNSLSRNKFSLALDLDGSGGRDLCLRLAAAFDVALVEPGAPLGAAALRAVSPELIVVSIDAGDAGGDSAATGLAAAAGTLTALFHHRATGQGQSVIVNGENVAAGLAVVAPAADTGPPALEGLDGFFEAVAGPNGGVAPLDGVPYRFSRTPAHVRLPAPALGEHTNDVLGHALELSDAEVAALLAAD